MSVNVDPATTALLVMDFQGGMLRDAPDADTLVKTVSALVGRAREKSVQVGFVRVGFSDADYDALPAHSRFAAIAANETMRSAMHADAPTTAIDERIAPQEIDIVVRKTRVGPFTSTDLHEQLRSRGIDTLVLAGLTTAGVVLSTVRQAADMDYRTIVLSDGCADPDPQVHETLMEKVFPRQAEVVTVDSLLSALS